MSTTMPSTVPLEKSVLSPEPLYRLLFGRPITQILITAYDLDIFNTLNKKPQTLEELCDTKRLPKHSFEMLVNTCVAIGLLTKEGDVYKNSPLSAQFLTSSNPFYLGGLIEHFRKQVFPAWDHLNQAVIDDGPQMSKQTKGHSSDIFQVTHQLDQETELFIAAMHNLSVSDGLVLAEAFDFSPFSKLVDVGGGSGALSLAVAKTYPNLSALVYDRPQVCAVADRYIAQTDLSGRVSTFPGDAFTDPLPKGVDVILLSLFIHAFGLKRSAPILKKCYDALPSGGCVLIYEPVLDPSRTSPITTLLSSLNMLVCTPSGGDVTAEEYGTWLKEAGFQSIFYKSVPAVRHLIGGYKP